MSRNLRVIVICYLCRRKLSSDSDWAYQIWIVLEVRPEGEEGAVLESILTLACAADAAKKLRERLQEAVAKSLAGEVEEMVWNSADDLSEDQVVGLVAGLPDAVKTPVQKALDHLAGTAGVPDPAAVFGADVTANLLLRPVLEPMENAVHVLELVGVIGGLATALHPLVITCAKCLIRDEIGSVLATMFEKLEEALTTVDAHEDETATSSFEPSSDVDIVAQRVMDRLGKMQPGERAEMLDRMLNKTVRMPDPPRIQDDEAAWPGKAVDDTDALDPPV